MKGTIGKLQSKIDGQKPKSTASRFRGSNLTNLYEKPSGLQIVGAHLPPDLDVGHVFWLVCFPIILALKARILATVAIAAAGSRVFLPFSRIGSPCASHLPHGLALRSRRSDLRSIIVPSAARIFEPSQKSLAETSPLLSALNIT